MAPSATAFELRGSPSGRQADENDVVLRLTIWSIDSHIETGKALFELTE
jgi:hypothetical protein